MRSLTVRVKLVFVLVFFVGRARAHGLVQRVARGAVESGSAAVSVFSHESNY